MSDYQKWAVTKDRSYADLKNRITEEELRKLHAVLGASGEVGELTDAVKKHVMYGKALDVDNAKEEIGDILWYLAILLESIDSSFDEVFFLNREKLEKRYPSGFSEVLAEKRLDKQTESVIVTDTASS